MQMQNIKLIRTKDNRLFLFYHSSGAVYCRQIDKCISENTVKIMDNATPDFSLWADQSGIYLLIGSSEGIHLCYYNFNRWLSRTMSKDFEPNCTKISFFSFGESVHLLYSVKADDGSEGLYIRSMKKENWSAPRKITDIIPFRPSSVYFARRQSPDKIKIYYRMSDKTIRFCTLNLESGSISEAENLLTTSLPCMDISIVTNGKDSHILYLAQGMFSSQLIYKGIRGGVQSKARIIWEGQLSGSCSLFLCTGKLYALIYGGSKVYALYSDNDGKTFSSAKNLGRISASCVKAEYLDISENAGFAADEVITDISSITFPVVSDIYPSFIPEKSKAAESCSEPVQPRRDNSIRAAEYEDQIAAMSS
ncbi:MAG: hypothetical protein LUE88_06495 [Clostridiales bacterium]|nr:hypothetical protein [Clostridiales bacterium]